MVKSEKREMRVKKIKFIKDEKGVSVIIGTLLMFAIFVSLFGAVQTTMVPVWNKGVEYDHLDVVYSDMMLMKSDIEDVALHKSPKSSDIHLGVRYPERMIFMNPGEGAAGMLTIESDVNISITYTTSGAVPITIEYSSSRITYELYGTIGSPKYVYEHGIIIKDFRTSSVTTDEQKLIVGDTIYIPILNLPEAKNLSSSSMDVESLTIHPYLKASTDLNVKSINITFDTAYPGIWLDEAYRAEFEAQFLDGVIPNELKTRDILGNLSSSINVSVSGNTITLKSNASDRIDLPNPDGPIDQPQSNQLYAGVLKCYMGELDPVWYYGETTASMSSGTQWANIPNSTAMTEFNITKLIFDESVSTDINGDYIVITVVDADWEWWRVKIGFGYKAVGDVIWISYLVAKSGAPGGAVNESTYLHPETGVPISGAKYWIIDPSTTHIDLLNESAWDLSAGDARYQSAGIGDINTLVTELYDLGGMERALIYYLMKIVGG